MQKEKKKILAISGSTKQNSSNEAILRFVAENFKNTITVEIFDSIDNYRILIPTWIKKHHPLKF